MIHERNPCVVFKNNAPLWICTAFIMQAKKSMERQDKRTESASCRRFQKSKYEMPQHTKSSLFASLRFVLVSILPCSRWFYASFFFSAGLIFFSFVSYSSAISFAHCFWINGIAYWAFLSHMLYLKCEPSIGPILNEFPFKMAWNKKSNNMHRSVGLHVVGYLGPLPSALPNNNLNEGYLYESKQREKRLTLLTASLVRRQISYGILHNDQ